MLTGPPPKIKESLKITLYLLRILKNLQVLCLLTFFFFLMPEVVFIF